jgi:hypothetical protein
MDIWSDPSTAPEDITILVRGPFGIATAQFGQGQFWAVAGNQEAYTDQGELLMLEGVSGWMLLPEI